MLKSLTNNLSTTPLLKAQISILYYKKETFRYFINECITFLVEKWLFNFCPLIGIFGGII